MIRDIRRATRMSDDTWRLELDCGHLLKMSSWPLKPQRSCDDCRDLLLGRQRRRGDHRGLYPSWDQTRRAE